MHNQAYKTESNHKRILLNKNQSGHVEYCESCEVVELAIGAISVRLHAQDLQLLSSLVQEAVIRLDDYNVDKAEFDRYMLKVGGVH